MSEKVDGVGNERGEPKIALRALKEFMITRRIGNRASAV
jgi:hypothetical protein